MPRELRLVPLNTERGGAIRANRVDVDHTQLSVHSALRCQPSSRPPRARHGNALLTVQTLATSHNALLDSADTGHKPQRFVGQCRHWPQATTLCWTVQTLATSHNALLDSADTGHKPQWPLSAYTESFHVSAALCKGGQESQSLFRWILRRIKRRIHNPDRRQGGACLSLAEASMSQITGGGEGGEGGAENVSTRASA